MDSEKCDHSVSQQQPAQQSILVFCLSSRDGTIGENNDCNQRAATLLTIITPSATPTLMLAVALHSSHELRSAFYRWQEDRIREDLYHLLMSQKSVANVIKNI